MKWSLQTSKSASKWKGKFSTLTTTPEKLTIEEDENKRRLYASLKKFSLTVVVQFK
jgi:hypothetical protein